MIEKQEEFTYMMAEYNGSFKFFSLHYDACEKITRVYILMIGLVVSSVGFAFAENLDKVNIFAFPSLLTFLAAIVSIVGVALFLMQIEHRIKLLFYVRNLNEIRKWMHDRFQWEKQRTLLPIDSKFPSYFRWGKDFFWEISFLGSINSILIAIFLVNFWNAVIVSKGIGCESWGSPTLVLLVIGLSLVQIFIFKLRCNAQERQNVY